MANIATKAARKTARKAVRSTKNYAKGYIAKGFLCWAIAAIIGFLPTLGIDLPEFLTGVDTVSMVAFIIVGFVFFGRRLSAGRVLALMRTMMK